VALLAGVGEGPSLVIRVLCLLEVCLVATEAQGGGSHPGGRPVVALRTLQPRMPARECPVRILLVVEGRRPPGHGGGAVADRAIARETCVRGIVRAGEIGLVAANACGLQVAGVIVVCVALFALQLGVRAHQREISLLVVVEEGPCPGGRVVALLAGG